MALRERMTARRPGTEGRRGGIAQPSAAMAKKPITPGQKAAKARDRERFAAKLATNEVAADRVYERLLNGDRLTRRSGGTYAFPGGEEVDEAIVSILLYRKSATLERDTLVPSAPDEKST